MMASALYCVKLPLREKVNDFEVLPGKEWTDWENIIKPIIKREEASGDGMGGWIKKRENWYINLDELKEFECRFDGKSGIYELCLKKGEDTFVVYIGSSCAEGGLYARLSQYATNGAHKALLIQKALSAGATIEARACTYKDCKTAHARENEILAQLDYLWKIKK